MVNPGGTGMPMLVISARLAPLPPRRFFISLLPSALPLPKKYVRLAGFSAAGTLPTASFARAALTLAFSFLTVLLTFLLTPFATLLTFLATFLATLATDFLSLDLVEVAFFWTWGMAAFY